MEKKKLNSFGQLLEIIGANMRDDNFLFRGQSTDEPLLPRIARKNPNENTIKLEKSMLEELRRIGGSHFNTSIDDWDLLVYAQHYGMATRLLDWTSNPLVGLWFACADLDHKKPSFLYRLIVPKSLMLNKALVKSPFSTDLTLTRIVKPNLNNERIIGQSGWFTAHIYSSPLRQFVPLEKNSKMTTQILQIEIPGDLKEELLNKCNLFGVNYQTIFPDIEGICRHINWLKL